MTAWSTSRRSNQIDLLQQADVITAISWNSIQWLAAWPGYTVHHPSWQGLAMTRYNFAFLDSQIYHPVRSHPNKAGFFHKGSSWIKQHYNISYRFNNLYVRLIQLLMFQLFSLRGFNSQIWKKKKTPVQWVISQSPSEPTGGWTTPSASPGHLVVQKPRKPVEIPPVWERTDSSRVVFPTHVKSMKQSKWVYLLQFSGWKKNIFKITN